MQALGLSVWSTAVNIVASEIGLLSLGEGLRISAGTCSEDLNAQLEHFCAGRLFSDPDELGDNFYGLRWVLATQGDFVGRPFPNPVIAGPVDPQLVHLAANGRGGNVEFCGELRRREVGSKDGYLFIGPDARRSS
jgi:hypothetical protein